MTEKDKIERDETSEEHTKRPVGRPLLEFPEPIDADPGDVVKAAFKLNPNVPGFEWQYLKKAGKPQKRK